MPTKRNTIPAVAGSDNRQVAGAALSEENILAVWANLRHYDMIELEQGTAPQDSSLENLAQMARDSGGICATLDGKPFALYGLGQSEKGAHPWMVATPDLARVKKHATKVARVQVKLWRELVARKGCPVWNIVLAESPSAPWLERIGFRVEAPFLRRCPNGELAYYRPFWLEA